MFFLNLEKFVAFIHKMTLVREDEKVGLHKQAHQHVSEVNCQHADSLIFVVESISETAACAKKRVRPLSSILLRSRLN